MAVQDARITLILSLCAALSIGGAAHARFWQPDPKGPKDDVNLYAYVKNDPLDRTDPTGTTCSGSGSDLHCQIDGVRTADGIRPATAEDHKQFASFEKSYTQAVKSLIENGGKSFTITTKTEDGHTVSFKITGGELARSLGGRTMFADPTASSQSGRSAGVTLVGRNQTFMGPNILNGSRDWQRTATGHEGIHSSLEERQALGPYRVDDNAHQQPYNDASRYLQGLP